MADPADAWEAVGAYLSRYGIVRHQIEAFDNFLLRTLPQVVQECPDMCIRDERSGEQHTISFCNLSVLQPTSAEVDGTEHRVLPHIARLRSLNYESNVVVDMVHDIYEDADSAGLVRRVQEVLNVRYAEVADKPLAERTDIASILGEDGVGFATLREAVQSRLTHVERRVFREVLLCTLPIMVGSAACYTRTLSTANECRLDQGGYFIVNGIEKALIAQERLRTNYPFVFALPRGRSAKYELQAEVRSAHDKRLRSTSTLYLYLTAAKKGSVGELVAELPFMQTRIPVLALFRLLRVGTREEVVRLVRQTGGGSGGGVGGAEADEAEAARTLDSLLETDATADMGTDELLDWLGREATTEPTKERRLRYLDHIVSHEILPHMGLSNEPAVLFAKAAYLAFVVRKLLRVHLGAVQPDDRDTYCSKRLDPSSVGMLFRQVFRLQTRAMSSQLYRLREQRKLTHTNVSGLLNHRRITNAFRYAFATGNWQVGAARGMSAAASSSQAGVVQMVSRMTVVAFLSNLRRINTPISREGKQPKPRQLHHTSWGIVCGVETPEGSSCGLVKNLAMLAHVRIGTSSDPVLDWLASEEAAADPIRFRSVGPEPDADASPLAPVPVLVNGGLVALRRLRCSATFSFDTTIARVDGAVWIDTDAGCLLRPLLVGRHAHLLAPILRSATSLNHVWDELLRRNVVEYVDKQEEMGLRVGLWCDRPDAEAYTHYELHPSLINGLCASLIPFPDANQAPRNTYQSAMCKQAVGVTTLNHAVRMDTVAHVLCEPQRPLVCTRMELLLRMADAPSGVNCIVAIMLCKGYNQEDSVIFNEDAIQRGLFRSVKYTVQREEERPSSGENERFERPPSKGCTGLRVGNYESVEEDGMPVLGRRVETGDVLIGKTTLTPSVDEANRGARKTVKRDRSVLHRADPAVVDTVLTSCRPDSSRTVKVKLRSTRSPVVGDKFCLTPEHEVLCEGGRGWVRIGEVRRDDRILCLVGSERKEGGRRMAYSPVLETHRFWCEEETIHVLTHEEGVQFSGTLDHRMHVRLPDEEGTTHRLVRVSDLDRTRRLAFVKGWKGGVGEKPLPLDFLERVNALLASASSAFRLLLEEDARTRWILSLLRLCGLAAAGGVVPAGGEATGLSCVLLLAPAEEARDLLSDLGATTTSGSVGDMRGDTIAYEDRSVHGTALRRLLLSLVPGRGRGGGGRGRALQRAIMCCCCCECDEEEDAEPLPDWMFRLGRSHAEAVVEGCILAAETADGGDDEAPSSSRAPPRRRRLSFRHARRAEDVGRICLHAGWGVDASSDHRRASRDEVAFAHVRVLHAPGDEVVVRRPVRPDERWSLVERRPAYTGPVHCVTVEDQVFLTRRLGVTTWTGNSSRMGQKGVIGRTFKQADMPYTASGIVPDIVINPHAIPSRMTIGMLRECLLGKLGALRGEIGDATAFSDLGIEDIADELEREGYDRMGNETMYNGGTGLPFEATVFVGPVYYQRLKHMVADKVHSRTRGPKAMLTRQPLEGRARDGGLRFGEMERDCILAHGVHHILMERLLLVSDAFPVWICGRCGHLALPPARRAVVRNVRPHCPVCERGDAVQERCIPYAFKLLVQELAAMHIGVQLLCGTTKGRAGGGTTAAAVGMGTQLRLRREADDHVAAV